MRVKTSRTILLWLAVVFLGGMLVLALAGDRAARRELPAQVATWGFIGLLFFLGWWFKVRPRRGSIKGRRVRSALRSAPGDPLGYFERPFALLGHAATAKDIENTSWGTWRGMDVVVIDYWFARVERSVPKRLSLFHMRRHAGARRVAEPVDRPGGVRVPPDHLDGRP